MKSILNFDLIKFLRGQHRNKCLLFTSAGDRSNIETWAHGNRNFDVYITYYGSNRNQYLKFKKVSDYCNRRKGSKFQNLKYLFSSNKDLLSKYDYIFVMDDDIIISSADINRLFDIHQKYELSISQPSFNSSGKISHLITKHQPNTHLRFTNFVEVTCPLFKTDVLFSFLEVYDPKLIGWGVDWWFLDHFESTSKNQIAIIDSVSCTNPKDKDKGGREINKLQSVAERRQYWEEIRKEHNITSREKGQHVYAQILIQDSVR